MTAIKTWAINRLYEGSTYVGGLLTAFSHVSVTLADPHQQSMLQAAQTIAGFLGPLMVGMSTRHK